MNEDPVSSTPPRPKRRIWTICLLPQWQWQRNDYEVQSGDGVDTADCWFFEVEWLGLYFSMAGGRFRDKGHGDYVAPIV